MSLTSMLKQIGKNIAACRKAQFINQVEAAARAGISYRYYQRIESGEANITLSTLYRLADLFNCHPCELIPKKYK